MAAPAPAVIGVPIDSLGTPGGTELAPRALRDSGIVAALGAEDLGDVDVRIVGAERDPASGIVGYPTVVTTCEGIRDALAPVLATGRFTIVLGGCCSLVPGVAAALRQAGIDGAGLAYIDGHLDTYDPQTSPTGEAADMPVAIVTGHGDPVLTGLAGAAPLTPPAAVALLAHRDLDEARALGSLLPADIGIDLSVDCDAVRADGPEQVGTRIATELVRRAGRFWVSIDVDVLSEEAFKATPYHQDGGLSAGELVALATPLLRHPACLGVDVLCYDVDMDDEARGGAATLVGILGAALAGR